MNDMSAPFTNCCLESELAAACRRPRRIPRGAFLSPLGVCLVASISGISGNQMPPGGYRGSYAVFVTVAVTPLSVARPARSREGSETRATAFRQPTDPPLFSFVG
jgi:hypothetical protein